MKTVVVGYDGSEAARAAVELGLERVRGGGRLLVVRSIEVDGEHTPTYDDRLQTASDEADASLHGLVAGELRFAFVDWERLVVAGEPAHVLCHIAEQRDADEVIVGTRGYDAAGSAQGSVAQAILRIADRPVTVVPAPVPSPAT